MGGQLSPDEVLFDLFDMVVGRNGGGPGNGARAGAVPTENRTAAEIVPDTGRFRRSGRIPPNVALVRCDDRSPICSGMHPGEA